VRKDGPLPQPGELWQFVVSDRNSRIDSRSEPRALLHVVLRIECGVAVTWRTDSMYKDSGISRHAVELMQQHESWRRIG
jgi:hypothetical protein